MQVQGVQTAKRSTSILEIVALNSPDGRYDSLFLSNYATINLRRRDRARRRRRQRLRVRRRPIRHAPLARPPEAAGAQPGAGRTSSTPSTCKAGPRAPDSWASRRCQKAQEFQYTINVPSKLDDVSQFEDIIIKADTSGSGRITRLRDVATHRARRPAVQPDLQAQREASGRARHLPAARRPTRSTSPSASRRRMQAAAVGVSRRA